VSSPCMQSSAPLKADGTPRRNNELVKALPFNSYRPGWVGVEHHSQTLPTMSQAPYGETPLRYRETEVVPSMPSSRTLHLAAAFSSPHG
jgi:hypothetical protein